MKYRVEIIADGGCYKFELRMYKTSIDYEVLETSHDRSYLEDLAVTLNAAHRRTLRRARG